MVTGGGPWFVTGGGGLLGRHVCRLVSARGIEVVAPTSAELDINDRRKTTDTITRIRPEVVIHLAYRKADPEVIVGGTATVAAAATAVGARMIHLSSDAVFGGRPMPYTESDPPTPVTDYGRWKTEAERIVTVTCPDAVVVRTSLMYESGSMYESGADESNSGALAPCQTDVLDALEGRNDIRFFTDEIRCFSAVDDVAGAVITLGHQRHVAGPLHVAAAEPLDRATFARHVAARAGRDPGMVPISTIAESGIVRPGRVVLDTSRAARVGITCRPVHQASGEAMPRSW